MLEEAGFVSVGVQLKEESKEFIAQWLPNSNCEDYVISANMTGTKPEDEESEDEEEEVAPVRSVASNKSVVGAVTDWMLGPVYAVNYVFGSLFAPAKPPPRRSSRPARPKSLPPGAQSRPRGGACGPGGGCGPSS